MVEPVTSPPAAEEPVKEESPAPQTPELGPVSSSAKDGGADRGDGLPRGDSDEDFDDEEDDDPEARIYAELLEEEAAKRRAAALEALNDMNTGQVTPMLSQRLCRRRIPCIVIRVGFISLSSSMMKL